MAINQGKVIEALESICKEIVPSEFIYQFLSAYGAAKTTISRLRDGSRNIATISGDTGVKKQLYFRPVDKGADVYACAEALKSESVIAANDIRFVMVTDFDSLVAFDLKADESLDTDIRLLDKQYAFFLPLIAGYEKAIMYSEHPADIKASEKMGQLFDLIRERNDLSKPEDIHALNVFLTRLLFCFYAEDTGIFEQDQMTKAIESTTSITGEDLDQFFADLFTALNLPDGSPEKAKLAAHFQKFPYVNGGLFKADEPIPEFSTKARRILLECGSLSWAEINPDIFGSMFQAVIDQEQRGNLGQHYTSASNIMKVIKPLFLDKLWDALDQSRGKEKKLKELLVRLQDIRVFDPACGSGNFLIIAYKELRKIEMSVIDALNEASAQPEMYYSGISLSQFYGIEVDDFAHEVAILSLWLAEHQMNLEFKDKFGYSDATLPLNDSGNVFSGNALRTDWKRVCPPVDLQGNRCEVYICGNPPFLGYNGRSNSQQEDMKILFEDGSSYKKLDYVASWFVLAARYISDNPGSSSAFVATNSICQGMQIPFLWPRIFSLDINISFAYQTFSWSNAARQKAAVHVVIIGLCKGKPGNSKIYKTFKSSLTVEKVTSINAYLVSGGDIIVNNRSTPVCGQPEMVYGNMPNDGGNLLLSKLEADDLAESPIAATWIKPALGAQEFLNGKLRFCLWLKNASQSEIEKVPEVKRRVDAVRKVRLESKSPGANKAASTPHLFWFISHPDEGNYLLVPKVSSERRPYIPIGFFDCRTVSTDANLIVPAASLYDFAILTSEMHNDWMRAVAGRLESRYRYSATLVYNTFPWPEVSEKQRSELESLAEEILMIREDYPDKTLADLYDPDKMPAPLLEAHQNLDRAVEKLYRSKPFADASERLEHLFGLYEQLIAKEKKGA
ncbi:DNA methyltransferase [uncultured Spongiibacter sp.]|uniref:DNA methyltransferase n=1 Tax=uncultured Spongiibacter sp. TaxID=870896 RepID=UPI00258336D2|nr:DNA methyltransferase [uncultured Spongiibacter sp.]